MSEGGSLKDLVIKSSKEAERILYIVLKDYVRFDEETKDIIFLEKFYELSEKEKVLLMLLAYKALEILGWVEGSSLSPKEVSDKTGVNYNTTKDFLNKLSKDKIITKVGRGKYRIDVSRLRNIASMFQVGG